MSVMLGQDAPVEEEMETLITQASTYQHGEMELHICPEPGAEVPAYQVEREFMRSEIGGKHQRIGAGAEHTLGTGADRERNDRRAGPQAALDRVAFPRNY